MDNVVIGIKNPTKNDFDNLTELMAKVQDEMVKYVNKLATELNVSESCAADVYYLRSRSRWTQELEDKLIELHRKGTPPNICEFS